MVAGMVIATDTEMPEKIFDGKKWQPNKWAHKVRTYTSDRSKMLTRRVIAMIPGAPAYPYNYFKKEDASVVGFIDYYIETIETIQSKNGPATILHIGYMTTRQDYRKHGIGWSMVQTLIHAVNPTLIEWGEIWHLGAQAIVNRAKTSYPTIPQTAKGVR